ncbi:MAG: hypothetical protein ACXVXP_03570 [Mycobacteriaceae bacterium]
MHDYDLNDADRFVKVLDLEVPWAHSYADMQPGRTDRERRENYRRAAAGQMAPIPANPRWWAFRIGVQKWLDEAAMAQDTAETERDQTELGGEG